MGGNLIFVVVTNVLKIKAIKKRSGIIRLGHTFYFIFLNYIRRYHPIYIASHKYN